MFTQWKQTAALVSAAALLCIGSNAALAEDHKHEEHNHSHAQHSQQAEPASQLALNGGKKWETDENLRQSMSRIRDALAAELHAIHTGKATAKQYKAIAKKANDQLALIVTNCKFDQKTDAMLHLVLADIIAGTDSMSGKDLMQARKGAEKIALALDNYGAYFAHPGWHVVKAAH